MFLAYLPTMNYQNIKCIDTVVMLKTLCQVYTPLRINALACLPTLSWFCMVNVGPILPYIDPMGTLIPDPTGLIGVTKEGKLQLLLRCLPSVQSWGRMFPTSFPGVFMGCFKGVFFLGCVSSRRCSSKRKNRIGKWRCGFLEKIYQNFRWSVFFFPASQKEVWFFLRESVLQTSTTMSNQYQMIVWFRWQRSVTLVSGKMAENIPCAASQPIYP